MQALSAYNTPFFFVWYANMNRKFRVEKYTCMKSQQLSVPYALSSE